MPKRKRGSGYGQDVNPQWWNLGVCSETVADTPKITTINTPLPRVPMGERSTVIEILGVEWTYDGITVATAANTYAAALKTANSAPAVGTALAADPSVLVQDQWGLYGASAASFASIPTVRYTNCQDADGHGILMAADQVFVYVGTKLTTGVMNVCPRVLYRFKNVGLIEYVGMLQSQANN